MEYTVQIFYIFLLLPDQTDDKISEAQFKIHKVCLKSNKIGAIKFFIDNRTKNQHYPLQSSSFGKPHTAGDIAPTPGSSAGSLHVEVPSARLSQPFGC